jgi:L-ascorbate metabolism protein UlaG (beta-lactamase superfamily)
MADSNATFTWYGHSCVELRTHGGKVVVFDPWFGNPTSPRDAADVTQCDVLLVTHGHFDHIGSAPRGVEQADALKIARATRPAWVCIHELSLWLETELVGAGVEIIGMNKGGTAVARGLAVTMVHADHSAGDWSAAGEGPLYLGEPVGFVIEIESGERVLFAGDTEVFGDMKLIAELHRPDIAFLPIGGHYTMGPAGAARAAQLLGVRAVVPIHYGTFPILAGTPDQLRQELERLGVAIEVIAPERGVATPLP